MTAVTLDKQFLVPNARLGMGRHYSNHTLSGMPSATLAIPAAGTYYFDTSGVLKPGLLNMGILLQPHGGGLQIAFTIADRDQVMDDPASVPWTTEPALSDQQLFSSGNRVPSVIRMIAASNMVVYAAAC